MAHFFQLSAAISGFLAVALGAFGAHALKSQLEVYGLEAYKTAVLYQFFHTLALVWVGLLCEKTLPLPGALKISGILFILGICLFSGSLYVLALSQKPAWGAITPIGGLCFLGAWGCLAYVFFQRLQFP